MDNQVPICSHTFQFYNGTSTKLDHLEAQFKKALNAHVKYFGPSKKQSVFIVFVNSDTDTVGECLRLQLEEYFNVYRKKNLESKMPTHKELCIAQMIYTIHFGIHSLIVLFPLNAWRPMNCRS